MAISVGFFEKNRQLPPGVYDFFSGIGLPEFARDVWPEDEND